jgi:putative salt-induced outer membrane protein YdiY
MLAAALSITGPLTAQDAPPPPRPWELTGDVGLVNTAGNSDVTTLNIGEKVTHIRGRVTVKQNFALLYGRTDGTTTTSQWRTGVRGDIAMSSRLAVFGLTGFDRNRFAGIDRRFEEGVGLAFKVLATERTKLDFETGLSMIQQRSTLDVTDNFAAARAASVFQYNVRPTAYFQQSVEVLPNLE